MTGPGSSTGLTQDTFTAVEFNTLAVTFCTGPGAVKYGKYFGKEFVNPTFAGNPFIGIV